MNKKQGKKVKSKPYNFLEGQGSSEISMSITSTVLYRAQIS